MDLLLILIVLLIVVLIWRGPTMLPRLGEAFGRTVRGVRENLPGARDDADDQQDAGTKSSS